MATKSDKGSSGKPAQKSLKETPKKASSKTKKQLEDENEEDDVDEEEQTSLKKTTKDSTKKTVTEEDDDDSDEVEVVDEWEKPEEEEEWDPDFEEFDLPKSKVKKTGGAKAGKGDDDELALDEEFKDMDLFNESGYDEEEEDF